MEYTQAIKEGIDSLSDSYKKKLLTIINGFVEEERKQNLEKLLDSSFGCLKDENIDFDIDAIRGRNRVAGWL